MELFMGPHTLFDKSFLQSLTVDESVWFDAFFGSVISPLFYVESLADLEKKVREGRTPELEVAIIADKFPQMGGRPCMHHGNAALAELLGDVNVPMTGQILMPGGRRTKLGEDYGIVWDQSPEAEAFMRWQQGQFLEIERERAKQWRDALNSVDLSGHAEKLRGPADAPLSRCASLEEARRIAGEIVSNSRNPFAVLRFAVELLSVPRQHHSEILERWRMFGRPQLSRFAPFTAHLTIVELFFQLGLSSGFIGAGRPSNRVDIAYLNYLPFCHVFVSSDSLHRKTALFFLRPNQTFVWGQHLKQELRAINEHMLRLPQSVKDTGVMSFARYPPEGCAPLVCEIWDKFAPGWRTRLQQRREPSLQPNDHQKLIDEIKRFENAPPLPAGEEFPEDSLVKSMTVKFAVRRRKGSWLQIGKDVPDSPASSTEYGSAN
jgi:hypothetical protein